MPLNEQMAQGPLLQGDLVSIKQVRVVLINWSAYAFNNCPMQGHASLACPCYMCFEHVFVADIEKMYRQVLIIETQQDLHLMKKI